MGGWYCARKLFLAAKKLPQRVFNSNWHKEYGKKRQEDQNAGKNKTRKKLKKECKPNYKLRYGERQVSNIFSTDFDMCCMASTNNIDVKPGGQYLR